jgi:hypothetical protein
MTPEQEARAEIDRLLIAAGWHAHAEPSRPATCAADRATIPSDALVPPLHAKAARTLFHRNTAQH